MAMLPFCGYTWPTTYRHWLEIGAREGAKLPKIFLRQLVPQGR
jgi:phosphoenolpyruvate carboxykinase (GTP)